MVKFHQLILKYYIKRVNLNSKILKTLLFIFGVFTFSSCGTPIKQIGEVNMISSRNIDSSGNYKRIKTYAGSGKKEIKRMKASTIENAVDNTVKSVPGGEYLMNAKLYIVDGSYYSVVGDVWGGNIEEYRGFKVGDKVQWKSRFSTDIGVITNLVDDKECMIKKEGSDIAKKINYDKIYKVGN